MLWSLKETKMKRIRIYVVAAAIVVVVGFALLLIFGLKKDTRPQSRSGPPPVPKAVRAKLDELAGQRAPVSPPENKPVSAVLPPKPEEPPPAGPAVVCGTVASTEGELLSNARVELRVGPNVRLGGIAEATFAAKTDREGKYKISGITVFGDACLGAFAQGFAGGWSGGRDNREGHWPYLRSVEAGNEYAEKDFKLPPALSQITGRVVNTARQPIPGAWVVVQDQEHEENSRTDGANAALTDADGCFAIDLPNDEYSVLEVYKKGYATGYFPWTKSNARDLVLVLEGGGAIVGHVSNLQGKPVPRVTVRADAFNDGKRAQNVWEGPTARQAATNDEGYYRIDDLPVAYEYRVAIPYQIAGTTQTGDIGKQQCKTLSSFLLLQENASSGFQEMRLGLASGRTAANKMGVRLYPGKETTVDFVVDDRPFIPAVIYGRVADPQTGQPVCPIWIYAVSDALPSPLHPLVAQCGTQQDGQYRMEIPNVTEPADIAIFAIYQRKMSMQDYLSQTEPVKTVRLGPGESAEVDISIPNSVTADLRIITDDGKPVPDAHPLGTGDQFTGSDALGEITLFCLEPRVVHQFVFEKVSDSGLLRGQSPPLSGEPGTRLPEQDVILYALPTGSAFGQIALPAGINEMPVSTLMCELDYSGQMPRRQSIPVTPEGAFSIDQVPAGRCTIVLYVITDDPREQWWALKEDVEIAPDQATDLGTVVPIPPAG